MQENLKERLYWILEAGRSPDAASRTFDALLCTLIVLNVAAVAAESIPALEEKYAKLFAAFEVFSIVVFTVEYLTRLWVCNARGLLKDHGPLRARIRFALTPHALIDLLAVAPFYLSFFVAADLRILRMFRMLRLLKLARYSPALSTIGRVLHTERRALVGSLLVMLMMLLIASSLIHFAEREAQPEKFGSIPHAMWWSMATLTTVGYGDHTPITMLGKMVGGVVMLCGVAMFALPIGIIATGFSQEIHRRDFVISSGMLARVKEFEDLTPASFIEILNILRAHRVLEGTQLYGDAIYFVVNGQLKVTVDESSWCVAAGGYVGDLESIDGEARKHRTIYATATSDLLVLESVDFQRLEKSHPDIYRRILHAT